MGFFSKIFGKPISTIQESNQRGYSEIGRLPEISSAYLDNEFGSEPEAPISGAGAEAQEAAVEASTNEEYDRAFILYEKVIELGLDEEYDMSLMFERLGELYLKRGDVQNAVKQFLKCLSNKNRAPSGVWQAAMRLYYIYDTIGRRDEANGVRILAESANKYLNWRHDPSLEQEIREITQRSGIS